MYCILHTVVTREKGPTQVCSTGDQYSVAARRGEKKKKRGYTEYIQTVTGLVGQTIPERENTAWSTKQKGA